MNEFRRASNEFRSQIESEINSLERGQAADSAASQAPLDSLASRIFNPPSAEKIEAAENRPAERPPPQQRTPPPAPKVAPDA